MKGCEIMAGKFISKFSGEEIDAAIMKALMFNPEENGWIRLSSTADNPVTLDDLTSAGNFIIDYFTGGNDDIQSYSPINVSVQERDGVINQNIIIKDNVYHRVYDDELMTYGVWQTRKTKNTFYIDELPSDPEENSLIVSKNSNDNYTLSIYKEGELYEVAPPDVMLGAVYDTQGRATDFYDYVDECFRQMTSSSIGVMWTNKEITELFDKEISSFRSVRNGNILVAFRNSTKIALINREEISNIELPVKMLNPQIIGYYDQDLMEITSIGLVDTDPTNPVIYWSDDLGSAWNELDVSSTGITSLGYYGKLVSSIHDNSENSVIVKHADGYKLLNIASDKTLTLDDISYPDYVDDASKEIFLKNSFLIGKDIKEGNDNLVAEGSTDLEYICYSRNVEPLSMGMEEDTVDISTYIAYEWVNVEGIYKRLPKFGFHCIDNSTSVESDVSIYISELDKYVVLSNFKEFLGNYTGYAISESGRIDKIELISNAFNEDYNPDLDPEFTVNISETYQESANIKWNKIFYNIEYLQVFGFNAKDNSSHMLYSAQDDNILLAVEDHILNKDIHFSSLDRAILQTRETSENAEVKFNRVTTQNKAYIDSKLNKNIEETKSLTGDIGKLELDLNDHISNEGLHVADDERKYWNEKAEADHTHILDGRVKIDASQVVSGVFPKEMIPDGAKEIIYKVADMIERNSLTIDDVQNGDRVAIKDGGIYEVVDETLLAHIGEGGVVIPAEEGAFHECSAGSGVFVDWKNVDNPPTTVAGYGITDTYTKKEADTEIDKRIEDVTVTLNERYETYDLDELHRTIKTTEADVNAIRNEMESAIALSRSVNEQNAIITEQKERIVALAEDMSKLNNITQKLLALYD